MTWAPGASVEVDGTDVAFPESFSRMPAGEWEAQAVLDPEHTYNYSGRGAADWVSPVVPLGAYQAGVGEEPVLTLDGHPAEGRPADGRDEAGDGGGEGGVHRERREAECGADAVLGKVDDGAGLGGAAAGIPRASGGAVSDRVLDGGLWAGPLRAGWRRGCGCGSGWSRGRCRR